jgi:homocysteine S-methyltransferase
MNPIATILRDHPALVLDGAMATELERHGCDLRDPLWSARVLIEAPQLIRDVHADYYAAGADVAITASYQATYAGFAQRGLNERQATELLQRSVTLARDARDVFWAEPSNRAGRPRPLVAASIGPYGAFLADGSEYRGGYDLGERELINFHRPRMAALLAAEPDLLACETIPCLEEARALASLLSEFPSATAWICFTAQDAEHTAQGERLSECSRLLDAFSQVVAVGVNCTSPHYVPAIVRTMAAATSKPIVVYPNSGEIYNAGTNDWSGASACTAFGEQSRDWYDAGARLIGGCCRTGPEHIRELAGWVRALRTDTEA